MPPKRIKQLDRYSETISFINSNGAAALASPQLSPWGSLLSRTLPHYRGPLQVGVFDLEVPVLPRNIGSFRHTGFKDAERGFKFETVLCSVFHPCHTQAPGSKRVVWFPKLSQTVNGFLKMARRTGWLYKTLAYPIAAAAIWGTTFPAFAEVPLLSPAEEHVELLGDGAHRKWPLIVFSHGVGCSRLFYSSYCGELASRGYIVVAVEHRDGSGPSTTIKLQSGETKHLDFLGWQDVEWPDLQDQPKDDTTLRKDQLALRLVEIEEAVSIMKALDSGIPVAETSLRSPDFDWSKWKGTIDVENAIIAGHSLGGSVALLAASNASTPLFKSVIALDPAIQRLEPWDRTIEIPFLCINSAEYTLSADFLRLQSLARTARNPPVYSISGSTHPSFSDVFLIVPSFINRRTGLKVPANEMIDTTVDITLAFLKGPEHTSEARLLHLLERERAQSQVIPSMPTVDIVHGKSSNSDIESTPSIHSSGSHVASQLPLRTRHRANILNPGLTSGKEPLNGFHTSKPNAIRAASYLAPMQGGDETLPYLNSEYAATGPIHAQLAQMRMEGAPSTLNLTGGRLGTLGSITEVLPSQLDDPNALGLPGTINWHPVLSSSEFAAEEAILAMHGHDKFTTMNGPSIDVERELTNHRPQHIRQSIKRRVKMEELLSDHAED